MLIFTDTAPTNPFSDDTNMNMRATQLNENHTQLWLKSSKISSNPNTGLNFFSYFSCAIIKVPTIEPQNFQ